MTEGIDTFEVVAREHLKRLHDAGEPPEQIVMDLSAVAASYASDGLAHEARVLRELIVQYRSGTGEKAAGAWFRT